jgi:hypothetical protein
VKLKQVLVDKAVMHLPIVLLAAAQLATAHFGVEYPEWRADTLTDEDGPYSQWDYPCTQFFLEYHPNELKLTPALFE